MLPLGFLDAAKGHPMLIETKDGTTLNGIPISYDQYMNIILKEVVQTSPEGDVFHRLEEVFVRGNNIKYLRMPDEIADQVAQIQRSTPSGRGRGRDDRGGDRGRGGRGRGRAGGRGGRGA